MVAQPTVRANSAVALMILNETRICFIFLVSSGLAVVVVLEMVSAVLSIGRRDVCALDCGGISGLRLN